MRAELERPDQNAVLVTPDRALARRVSAELRRWDIEVDDSAGVPLGETPTGAFLRLLARAAAEEAAPVPLLAVLKHRSEEHTSELQSLMRTSYAAFCLKTKKNTIRYTYTPHTT